MQCAWCRCRYTARGQSGGALPALLPEASHGLCHVCANMVVRAQRDHWVAIGNRIRALKLERTRLKRLAQGAQGRLALRAGRAEQLHDQTVELLARSRKILA